MRKAARHFLRDRSGATAIEYALVAGIIATFIIGGAAAFGEKVKAMFVNLASNY